MNPAPALPQLRPPVALNEFVCGNFTGPRPVCEITSLLPNSIFTAAVAGSNNDYQSLTWSITSLPDPSSTVTQAGVIDANGVVSWNEGFFGSYYICISCRL